MFGRGVVQQPLDFTNAGSVSAAASNRRLVDVDKPVVLGVEDRVDGRQRDVLVAASVAGDEMRIEHFVVVGAGVSPSSPTPGSESAVW